MTTVILRKPLAILDLVSSAKIVKGVKTGTLYLLQDWSDRLAAEFIVTPEKPEGFWRLSTGEFSLNYYEGNPDFELIAQSK